MLRDVTLMFYSDGSELHEKKNFNIGYASREVNFAPILVCTTLSLQLKLIFQVYGRWPLNVRN